MSHENSRFCPVFLIMVFFHVSFSFLTYREWWYICVWWIIAVSCMKSILIVPLGFTSSVGTFLSWWIGTIVYRTMIDIYVRAAPIWRGDYSMKMSVKRCNHASPMRQVLICMVQPRTLNHNSSVFNISFSTVPDNNIACVSVVWAGIISLIIVHGRSRLMLLKNSYP